jgi:hypothetical protein
MCVWPFPAVSSTSLTPPPKRVRHTCICFSVVSLALNPPFCVLQRVAAVPSSMRVVAPLLRTPLTPHTTAHSKRLWYACFARATHIFRFIAFFAHALPLAVPCRFTFQCSMITCLRTTSLRWAASNCAPTPNQQLLLSSPLSRVSKFCALQFLR